jgi:hypothetical protein
MGANYLDSIIEIKKGGNYLPPFFVLGTYSAPAAWLSALL